MKTKEGKTRDQKSEAAERLVRGVQTMTLSVGLLAGLTGCSKQQPAAETPRYVELTTAYPSVGAPIHYTVSGTIVSDHRVDVSSKLSGYIREILVQEGDVVREGQTLAIIDGADVDGAIRQARALVTVAELSFQDAETDHEKFQALFERGSISDNEMRKIRLKHEAARETVNQTRAGLDTALSLKAYSEIKSPVSGSVVAKLKRAGDMALPGLPVLQIEEGRRLVFETYVAESQVGNLKPGQPVEIAVDRLASPFQGSISRIVLSGDPVTRSYLIKVALPSDLPLMPGMYGRASFVVGESKALTIPRDALVERGGLSGVYVVDPQNIAHFRWVRLAREWPDRAEISAGLSPHDRIAVSIPGRLAEGMTVKESVR
jgi:membrane fusion protein, multidrug efflux system